MARVSLGDCLSKSVVALLWFLVLWFISMPLALFLAPWYVFVQPFEVVFGCGLNKWLIKGVNLPEYCTREMLKPFGWDGALEGYVNLPEP
uniref:Uncharacterized protein n=1 Tax=Tetraselmis sp. GSL018 TaxID=582737 RepID=A0A061S442_9CHLO